MKRRVNYTIEGNLLDRLEDYIVKRLKTTGSKVSRSSIVEEALIKHLTYLENELYELKDQRDISIAR